MTARRSHITKAWKSTSCIPADPEKTIRGSPKQGYYHASPIYYLFCYEINGNIDNGKATPARTSPGRQSEPNLETRNEISEECCGRPWPFWNDEHGGCCRTDL